MKPKALLRWLGPVLLLLVGLLLSFSARRGWLRNDLFRASFYIDLASLLLFAGFLAALIWAAVNLIQFSSQRKIKKALADEQIAQVQERKRFFRRLDHELKNPLTTIRLGITNLQQDARANEEMQGSLERISHQAQRLQTLVENLRRLSEMDENSMDRVLIHPREILEEAKEAALSSPERQGRTVNLTIQQVPWPVSSICGDRDLLVVAFSNLIENALKFSGPDGQVEVRATEDGRSVLVEIDDNGRGIQPEDLPHIFDELYRGENARDLPGSGLGLALVRRIIELHGGSVELRSRPDQGTMVRVHLPASSS